MQSGQAKKGEWKIDWDVLDKWENPVGSRQGTFPDDFGLCRLD